jgi:hypothetical protein
MTNEQLAGARKAQRRFPEATFRPVTGGVMVNGVLVPVSPEMTPDDVFKALGAAASG